jgi:hypothetical protein
MLGRERVRFLMVDDPQHRTPNERARSERVMATVIKMLGLSRCPDRIYTARRYMRMQKRLPSWTRRLDTSDETVRAALDLPADMRLSETNLLTSASEWSEYNRVLTFLWIDSTWPQQETCAGTTPEQMMKEGRL